MGFLLSSYPLNLLTSGKKVHKERQAQSGALGVFHIASISLHLLLTVWRISGLTSDVEHLEKHSG